MNIIDHNHEFVKWVFDQHNAINHVYDKNGAVPLPYTFHLSLAASFLDKEELQNDLENIFNYLLKKHYVTKTEIAKSIYSHDILENVSSLVSYNDLLKAPGIDSDGDNPIKVAELVLAVTDFPGRNKKERKPPQYYKNIYKTHGGPLVKIADFNANVEYGLLTNSDKVKGYIEDYPSIKNKIYLPIYDPLFKYLEKKMNL